MLGLNYRTLYAPQLCSKIVCARDYIFRHLLDCFLVLNKHTHTHVQFDNTIAEDRKMGLAAKPMQTMF